MKDDDESDHMSECDHRELSASVRLLSSNVGRASDWQLLSFYLYTAITVQ